MKVPHWKVPLPRALRTVVLGVVLTVVALVVPASTVATTESVLVKVEYADAVATEPNVVWILAVGSDARPGEDLTRVRGDALQLIGMDTRTGAATAIGIPRDSYVSIPGYGSNRVNAALYYGGPDLLGRTVGEMVGIRPDYVFVTRFPFFEDMVDDIGGIRVENPRAFSDSNLKADGFPAGTIKLDGYSAMAFSRIRKTLPGGDFDRSANQQRVLVGIQRKIRGRSGKPGFIEDGVRTVIKHTATDASPGELFHLARAIAAVRPEKVTTCVVPGGIGQVGAASVVFPDLGTARDYGDQARKDATIERC